MAGNPGGRLASGALEAEIMAILQGAQRALTTAEVKDELDRELAYTTVVTTLSRMHAKGLLSRTKVGRSFTYRPVSDEPGLAAQRMRQVMDGRRDREAVLARFVGSLSGDDERLLRELLGTTEPPDGS